MIVEFSQQSTSWKIILEQMIGIVISEVDALMYIVLGKGEEKFVPFGELVGITECMML